MFSVILLYPIGWGVGPLNTFCMRSMTFSVSSDTSAPKPMLAA